MSDSHDHRTTVLVVGGGVTGLTAALLLSRRGVPVTLVERHPSTTIMPKARAFNPRSLEIYRALGLEEEIRARQSLLVDFPEMMGADTLVGEERWRFDLLAQVRPPEGVSPCDWALIDQDELERILCAAAERAGADIRFATELVSVDAGADGVTASVRAGDVEYRVLADYLVAADGNRAGIRRHLGVGVDQPGATTHAVHAIFDADLSSALRGRRFVLAYLDHPTPGTVLVPMSRFGRWMIGVPCAPALWDEPEDRLEEFCVDAVRRATGMPDLDVTLVPHVPGREHKVSRVRSGGWVAHRYRVGRVFFAGDAAHIVPPTGSYGANTAIADAHNLAWKLAAVIEGTAGAELLDAYEEERRPVAVTTLETAMAHLRQRQHGTGNDDDVVDDLTMIFGYSYAGPREDPRTPSGRPGLRAPHVWLERAGARVSTHDLFAGGFTLLVGSDGGDWSVAAKSAAETYGVGINVHADDRLLDRYGITRTGASLVRPDGFVAWRAIDLPDDPDRCLGQVLLQELHLA